MKISTVPKIFLVDDDEFCIEVYQQHLYNLGLTDISAYSTGKAALKDLHLQPGLVFLDYNLGDIKGLELLMMIKSYNPQIYVVMISGQSNMDITIQLLNQGAFDYIIKDNFETEKISGVIGKWYAACDCQKKLLSMGKEISGTAFEYLIIEAQERVRKEISAELHDNVSQLLGASKLYIEAACADEENRLALLKETQGIIIQAIDEIRKLSHSLQAVYSSKGDLEKDLPKFVTLLQKQKKFKLTTNIQLNGLPHQLCSTKQQHIMRIIQEQVNNISKYAKATCVILNISMNRKNLHLRVIDDGVGFETAQAVKGLGINSIINRIQQLGGQYEINAAPGKGCDWNICIPLKTAEKSKPAFRLQDRHINNTGISFAGARQLV